jgi:hypothetical protein
MNHNILEWFYLLVYNDMQSQRAEHFMSTVVRALNPTQNSSICKILYYQSQKYADIITYLEIYSEHLYNMVVMYTRHQIKTFFVDTRPTITSLYLTLPFRIWISFRVSRNNRNYSSISNESDHHIVKISFVALKFLRSIMVDWSVDRSLTSNPREPQPLLLGLWYLFFTALPPENKQLYHILHIRHISIQIN